MASLKDVAELAGVSVSTVSYVINGKKTVRPETYKKIMDAIAAVDYHPNMAARSLKTKESKSIGVVVADFTNIFYIDVLTGIESELAKAGYTAIVSNSRNDDVIERSNLREMVHRNVDGVILLGTGGNETEQETSLNMPVVSVDRVYENHGFTVSVDNVFGGYMGASYLLKKGRRNLAFIGFNQKVSAWDRVQGCQKAIEEYGLSPSRDFTYIETDISPKGGYEATMRLFHQLGRKKCDGIFAASDYMAFGVLKALADLSYSVPDDISVLGFDDILLSQFSQPSLTTISQPKTKMGIKAAEMMMRILGREEVENRIILEPKLVVRDSA